MDETRKRKKAIARWIGAIAIVILYILFFVGKSYLTKPEIIGESISRVSLIKRTLLVTVMAFGGIGVSLWEIALDEKWNRIATRVLFFLAPFFAFFALEYANVMNSLLPWQVIAKLGISRSLTTVFILFLLLFMIWLISGSMKIAAAGVNIAVCIFGLVNYFVYDFRGNPLLSSDLSIMGTAFNVMGSYQYQLEYKAYVLILAVVIWCIAMTRLKKVSPVNRKRRFAMAAGYGIILIVSVYVLGFTSFLKDHLNVNIKYFRAERSFRENGAILTFVESFKQLRLEEPEGYDRAEIQAIADEYGETVQTETMEPNVIVIMDEAFSDLQSIGGFQTNEEVMPFISNLTENTVKGNLYVNIFGGKTANTEYEFLTGNSEVFMPPSAVPYQTFVKEPAPSLTTVLKAQGYQGNLAMHPYIGSGYNRPAVYSLLGFEDFLTQDDYDNPEIVRKYISDKTNFEKIILEYEKAKEESDAPFYMFNVTMQNHTPYDEDYDNFPLTIQVTNKGLENKKTRRYLNLVHLSDQALQMLVEYFDALDDPTVVVFFGDHQPRLPDNFYQAVYGGRPTELEGEDLMQRYKVPYIIWANYDIEEKEEDISVNYLSTMMMQSAKMQMPGYNQFLAEVKEEIPVLTVNGCYDADGNFFEELDESSSYYEIWSKYKKFQYNNMFDPENRIQNFYD